MQLLTFWDFHLKAFTLRREAVKVAHRKGKKLFGNFAFLRALAFFKFWFAGSWLNKVGSAVVLFFFNVTDFTLAEKLVNRHHKVNDVFGR